MAFQEHAKILIRSVEEWNNWRKNNRDFVPDLMLAYLHNAKIPNAQLYFTNLKGAILTGQADLMGANLMGADLLGADLTGADLTGANLSLVNLTGATLEGAILNNCKIYGINVWDIKGKPKEQKNLIITLEGEPIITVDNLEVAHFIYLMLNNEKIRDVIGTIAKKGVLILGRFSERKKILEAIREKLRQHDFVPMMFDFEKVESRDFTETIKILAGMSKFVIADITNPRSCPLELQATIPDYKIPFIPIIEKGEEPFPMFKDLQSNDWVSPVFRYSSLDQLMDKFQAGILNTALEIDEKLKIKRMKAEIEIIDLGDIE